MRRPRNDTESLHIELPILQETDSAYKVAEEPRPRGIWLPKSQVVKGEQTGENIWEFEVPGWLAINKRLV